jgi:hypothetical protein
MESNDLEICCYTHNRRVKRKRGQATKVCQSHKGNDHSPFGRLGKYGTQVEEATSETAHYRGIFICSTD